MKIIVLFFLVKNLTYVIHKEFQVRGGNHSLCFFGVFDPRVHFFPPKSFSRYSRGSASCWQRDVWRSYRKEAVFRGRCFCLSDQHCSSRHGSYRLIMLIFSTQQPPKKKHTQQCKPWKNEEMMYLWESWFSGWLKYVTWLPFPVKMPPYDLVPPSRCHKTAAGPSAQGLDMLEGIESSWSRWAKIRI